MEALLIMILFAVTALSLYFTANGKNKIAGGFDVVSLCLIVAVAYQFELISTIVWVVIGIVVVLIAAFVFMQKRKRDRDNNVIEYKGE
ncbi:MAG: hypothetical protein ACK5LC_10590 [Coprobacillaceae bacterium]